MKKSIIEWIIAILIGLTLAFILTTFVFTRYTVKGNSMDPTFKNKEELIVNKLSTRFYSIDRGDVIVFHATKNKDYIKRLIGKPGDEVKYKKDKLYINGKYVDEPYLKANKNKRVTKYLTENFSVSDLKKSKGKNKIPKDKYLVLGDNRFVSNDSRRDLGLLDKDKVVGKVFVRLLPLNEFKGNFYSDTFDKVNK
ncbi:signal peptidase I [Staphylococcus epidermidis]|jgi:signal peptidase I|uniref:signal peptidase I n=1 Tax=Staphylococcus epidermidis TaxID=1282 RepID=UPI0007E43B41|nr:signal peptidase I [Staphylococcus epidermidis]MCG1272974.1 signal peptidase I [Staphylococcus epidermidis]SUM61059.1 type-1 signal peptidase 1B [Staphylococcus epidermidis]